MCKISSLLVTFLLSDEFHSQYNIDDSNENENINLCSVKFVHEMVLVINQYQMEPVNVLNWKLFQEWGGGSEDDWSSQISMIN